MKQIIEYIRSYSKALLQKMGVQVAEHPRHKTVQRGGSLFGPNVGGKHEARIVPALCLMRP